MSIMNGTSSITTSSVSVASPGYLTLKASITQYFNTSDSYWIKVINDTNNNSNTYESLDNIDTTKLKNFLSSAYGFGYYYVREKGKKLFIYPILTAEDAYKLVMKICQYCGISIREIEVTQYAMGQEQHEQPSFSMQQ